MSLGACACACKAKPTRCNMGRTAYLSLLFLLLVVAVEVWVFTMETNRRVKALRIHVFTIQELITFLIVWYIWKRVTYLFKSGNRFSFSSLIKITFFVLLGFAQLCVVVGLLFVGQDPAYISSISNTCLGVVIFLFCSLAAVDCLSFTVRKIFCRGSQWQEKKTVRFEIQVRSLLAFIAAVIFTFTGFVGMSRFTVERITVPIKGLDPRLNGTTLLQLSDLHLGGFSGRSALQRIVNEVNHLDSDLVVITGDLVDGSVESLREAVQPLKTIRSKQGVYYCTGNHEYYTGDVDNWIAELPRFNVTPLINSRVCLGPPGNRARGGNCTGGLYLAGVEDYDTRHGIYGPHSMDFKAALSSRIEGVPTVVLAHQPRAAMEAVKWKDVRLVLSGHTHAGQIIFWAVFVYLGNPLFVGLYEPHPDVFVYVSPGTLYYLVPFRHYRPEITLFTLVCG